MGNRTSRLKILVNEFRRLPIDLQSLIAEYLPLPYLIALTPRIDRNPGIWRTRLESEFNLEDQLDDFWIDQENRSFFAYLQIYYEQLCWSRKWYLPGQNPPSFCSLSIAFICYIQPRIEADENITDILSAICQGRYIYRKLYDIYRERFIPRCKSDEKLVRLLEIEAKRTYREMPSLIRDIMFQPIRLFLHHCPTADLFDNKTLHDFDLKDRYKRAKHDIQLQLGILK